jgi:hypothetical protein
MDILLLDIDLIPQGSSRIIDGIEFESVALVVPSKECSLAKIASLNDALVVLDELKNSLNGNGKYLIFTDASGIADDGGWVGVDVKYDEKFVYWDFFVGDEKFKLTFDSDSYRSEIEKILVRIANLPSEIELEPSQVVFPEDW